MQIRVTENDKTTEIIHFVEPADPNEPLFKHTDAEGDMLVVFRSFDDLQGVSVYLRTSHMGCSIPVNRLEEFFEACREAVKRAQEGQ